MANITEELNNPQWSEGIYQLETTDPVLGRPNGIANRQAKELAARTQYLKKKQEEYKPGAASDTKAGITKLNNTLISTATDAALTAAQGKVLAERLASYLPLTGGTINGGLAVQGDNPDFYGIAVNNTNPAAQGTYAALNVGGTMRGGIETHGAGRGSYHTSLTATAEGDARDRHERVLTASAGHIWTKAYGNLHDYFCSNTAANNLTNALRNEINGRFTHSNYPDHYAGAEVWRMPNGLKITMMQVTGVNATGDFYLPEAYQGRAIAVANDVGDGRRIVSSYVYNGTNRIKIFVSYINVSINIIVIGWANH